MIRASSALSGLAYPSVTGPSYTAIPSLIGRSDGYNRTSFTKPFSHPIPPSCHLLNNDLWPGAASSFTRFPSPNMIFRRSRRSPISLVILSEPSPKACFRPLTFRPLTHLPLGGSLPHLTSTVRNEVFVSQHIYLQFRKSLVRVHRLAFLDRLTGLVVSFPRRMLS